ncbi:hypothetical protein F2P81_019014 [Scophthalmus maximus]|uniref:PRKC apoptosis WT1 regulator protein n=1 Tax=Scophthalmus maximus TaxID=52904 RepID=A0A6A4SBA0_SCOMX|nr:hypothetical protein F2P81_019014 [Scophthalmus maximus]
MKSLRCSDRQSLDELDDDDAGEKDRREEELVQANTFQNEAMAADAAADHLMSRDAASSSHHTSLSRVQLRSRKRRAPSINLRRWDLFCVSRCLRLNTVKPETVHVCAMSPGEYRRVYLIKSEATREMRLLFLRELSRERQENGRLVKAQQDKDDLIGKLKEEIDLLNRDLDDIEDENEQLKQENKTLLKVVGQLTRLFKLTILRSLCQRWLNMSSTTTGRQNKLMSNCNLIWSESPKQLNWIKPPDFIVRHNVSSYCRCRIHILLNRGN